jgi:hypothetical protein
MIHASEVELGDIVSVTADNLPYLNMTAIRKTGTEVKFIRPYIHTSDFTSIDGLIPYIGFENIILYNSELVYLVRKNTTKFL